MAVVVVAIIVVSVVVIIAVVVVLLLYSRFYNTPMSRRDYSGPAFPVFFLMLM